MNISLRTMNNPIAAGEKVRIPIPDCTSIAFKTIAGIAVAFWRANEMVQPECYPWDGLCVQVKESFDTLELRNTTDASITPNIAFTDGSLFFSLGGGGVDTDCTLFTATADQEGEDDYFSSPDWHACNIPYLTNGTFTIKSSDGKPISILLGPALPLTAYFSEHDRTMNAYKRLIIDIGSNSFVVSLSGDNDTIGIFTTAGRSLTVT